MAKIESQIEINSNVDAVWKVVSDLDREPTFWKGTKKVRNISKNENTVEREITIAFRDQKCLQTIKLTPHKKIEAVFTEGIIVGRKTITLLPINDKIIVNVIWDVSLTGMMSLFTGMIKKHIKNGTEQALQNIKAEIEHVT